MEKSDLLVLILFSVIFHHGISAPFPDPGLAESVYGAPARKSMENSIEKAPVASPLKAAPPPPAAAIHTQRQQQQLEQQKEQLKQLKVKLLEKEERAKQNLVAKTVYQPKALPPAPQPVIPKAPELLATKQPIYSPPTNPPYLDNPTFSNHLDDYPPKDGLDPLTGYHNTPSTPQVFHPIHPGHYRGYPYMYGYPMEMRYGYAYGHAFTTDDNFKCPSDGRYYRDFGSFYSCEGGTFKVQFCAPGSRNSLPTYHKHEDEVHPFCNVNIVGSRFPMLIPH